MNTYTRRAVKYLIWLTLLFVLIFTLMMATGTSAQSPAESLQILFGSQRGLLMIGMILVLALFYPRFGFVRREIKANLDTDREKIIQAFEMSRFMLVCEEGNRLTFRTRLPIQRALLLWEDTVTLTADDNYVTIEGIRKEVVKIEYRMKALVG